MNEIYTCLIYYPLMLLLLAGFLVSMGFTLWKHRKVFTSISPYTYYKLIIIVLIGIGLRLLLSPFYPQVFYDEFLYMGIAENMSKTGITSPYMETGYPQVIMESYQIIPPYPQLWAVVLSFIFRTTLHPRFHMASDLSLYLSCFTVIIVFFAGYFLFSSKKEGSQQEELAEDCGDIAGLFSALMWACLPVVIKLTGCASPEIASSLFIWIYLMFLFLYYRERENTLFLTCVLALALAIHGRPENILYILLLIPVLYRTGFKVRLSLKIITALILIFYICLSLLVMHGGRIDSHRAQVFQIEARPQFYTPMENFFANLKFNLFFFGGYNLVHPWILTVFFVAGLVFFIIKKDSPFLGRLFLGWTFFFYLVLSIFPFGDFCSCYGYDSFRFSLHVYFPFLLCAGYGCFGLWNLLRKSIGRKVLSIVFILVIIFSCFYFKSFYEAVTPESYYFNIMKDMRTQLPEGCVVVTENMVDCLTMRYASSLPTIILQDREGIKNLHPRGRRFFLYLLGSPSDLILENFDMNLFMRRGSAGKEYSIIEIIRTQEVENLNMVEDGASTER